MYICSICTRMESALLFPFQWRCNIVTMLCLEWFRSFLVFHDHEWMMRALLCPVLSAILIFPLSRLLSKTTAAHTKSPPASPGHCRGGDTVSQGFWANKRALIPGVTWGPTLIWNQPFDCKTKCLKDSVSMSQCWLFCRVSGGFLVEGGFGQDKLCGLRILVLEKTCSCHPTSSGQGSIFLPHAWKARSVPKTWQKLSTLLENLPLLFFPPSFPPPPPSFPPPPLPPFLLLFAFSPLLPPSSLSLSFFKTRSRCCPGWSQLLSPMNPPASASWVAETTGVHHLTLLNLSHLKCPWMLLFQRHPGWTSRSLAMGAF
jgi:hypothetical protein